MAWGLILGLSPGGAAAGDGAAPALLPGAAAARPVNNSEVIRERYPNGALRIERQVAQDAEGNYLNHGSWKMWDQQGHLTGTGQYRDGLRHGPWVRHHKAGEAEIVAGPIGRQFEAPFTSEATFVKGKIDGQWAITDAQQRRVISWQYQRGQRHGQSVWWFPNGRKWRAEEYNRGEVDGEFTEWSPEGKIVASEQYVDGCRLGSKIEWHEPGKKKVEAQFLFAKEITQLDENWWAGYSRLQVTGKQGQDVRQGRTVTYYPNGQKAMQANYRADKPHGTFVWWRSNGQKAIEGQYAAGKQVGSWAWWHPNGQKWIQGDYQAGLQIGRWTWWTDTGAVLEAAVFVDEDPQQPGRQGLETAEVPPELSAPPPGPRKASFSRPAVSVAPARK
jgi:antitoxin component YwqK of YwqJK toxin-antitoxin module